MGCRRGQAPSVLSRDRSNCLARIVCRIDVVDATGTDVSSGVRWRHVPELQQSRRFAIAITFACSTPIRSRPTISDGGPPCAAKPLLFTRWDNPLLYAWA